jgi:hypothetical protein
MPKKKKKEGNVAAQGRAKGDDKGTKQNCNLVYLI